MIYRCLEQDTHLSLGFEDITGIPTVVEPSINAAFVVNGTLHENLETLSCRKNKDCVDTYFCVCKDGTKVVG